MTEGAPAIVQVFQNPSGADLRRIGVKIEK